MATFLLISAVLLLSLGVVAAFLRPMPLAVCASYAGLTALWYSGYAYGLSGRTLLFWAIAVIIVCGIRFAGGSSESDHIPSARYYIAGGALAAMLAAFTLGQGWMIAGAATGAIVGAVAWNRTPRGRISGARIWNMIVSTGLPVTIAMTITGLALDALLKI